MAKKFTASATQLKPDPVYHSKLVAKFINCLMLDGKKNTAQKVFYDAMKIVEGRVKDTPPLEVFETAIDKTHAGSEVKACRWCKLPGSHAGASEASAITGFQVDTGGIKG